MNASGSENRSHWTDGAGFTLPEVLITIVILGILAGIAVPSWFGLIEGRAVDSATNQLTSDMRLAHARATNQLNDWAVVSSPATSGLSFASTPTGSDYYLVKIPSSGSIPSSNVTGRELDESDRAQIATSTPVNMLFKPDGSVTVTGASTIQVHVKGSAYNSNPHHNIEVAAATSRVKID